MHQADIRERCGMAPMRKPHRRGEESDRRLAALPDRVMRLVAATIFFHRECYSAQQVASVFGWSVDDLIPWLEAGKPLL
jgi:hypothetical protein